MAGAGGEGAESAASGNAEAGCWQQDRWTQIQGDASDVGERDLAGEAFADSDQGIVQGIRRKGNPGGGHGAKPVGSHAAGSHAGGDGPGERSACLGLESDLDIDYQQITAEEMAQQKPAAFDIITCMEMLEHVPDPASVISACFSLVKPGGSVYFSTINRNPKSYAFAIVGAEYLMKMLPRGTHDYAKFIKPSELDGWARSAGLQLVDLKGVSYNPFTGLFSQSRDVDVNYMVQYTRPQ